MCALAHRAHVQENNTGAAIAALGAADDEDDGYVSPEFDLPSESEDEPAPPPSKRARGAAGKGNKDISRTLADEEELALRLLSRQ